MGTKGVITVISSKDRQDPTLKHHHQSSRRPFQDLFDRKNEENGPNKTEEVTKS
jgi:hypothetical protein